MQRDDPAHHNLEEFLFEYESDSFIQEHIARLNAAAQRKWILPRTIYSNAYVPNLHCTAAY
jgi:hypothetical protein